MELGKREETTRERWGEERIQKRKNTGGREEERWKEAMKLGEWKTEKDEWENGELKQKRRKEKKGEVKGGCRRKKEWEEDRRRKRR